MTHLEMVSKNGEYYIKLNKYIDSRYRVDEIVYDIVENHLKENSTFFSILYDIEQVLETISVEVENTVPNLKELIEKFGDKVSLANLINEAENVSEESVKKEIETELLWGALHGDLYIKMFENDLATNEQVTQISNIVYDVYHRETSINKIKLIQDLIELVEMGRGQGINNSQEGY